MQDKQNQKTASGKGAPALIDPVYQKFTKGVLRAISSTDFYEFFMDAISKAENAFQFSNRKLEKAVDLNWVEAIENALPAMQNIISNPRNVIREEELIVNAAHAKKVGPDVVRHLTQHASFVEDYNQDSGDVRPTKVMQKFRDDSQELYENRLVFTTMEMAYHFVSIRHDALFDSMSDEYGAKLKVNSDMDSATEHVHMEMYLHIKEIESAMDADERNADTFNRISRIYRLLGTFMNTQFARQMAKVPRVKGNIVKTNILKKNPDYRKVEHLLEFLRGYTQIGYSIRVIEQNPQINETFQRDIFHNIMFNYMILKGYLEDDSDRVVPGRPKEKQRTLKPHFIHEIIEELTEDYDLPDVEIRKVLIEELTKAQLMKEEAKERRRLVEEQARRKKEEAERLRQEKEAEKERLRREKEAEKERIRQEQEAEKKRLFHERMLQEAEDRRRGGIFLKQIEIFEERKKELLEARKKAMSRLESEKQDFADAVRLLEEAEQRKAEQLEREKRRRQAEKERLEREQQLKEERLLEEKQLRLKQEQLAREEQLREEEERRRKALLADREALKDYINEYAAFAAALSERKRLREAYESEKRLERLRLENERRQRRIMKAGQVH